VAARAKALAMSVKADLTTVLPAKAHRVVTLRRAVTLHPAPTLAPRVVISRHGATLPRALMPAPRARTSHPVVTLRPVSLPLASPLALPSPPTVAKCLCHGMLKSVRLAAPINPVPSGQGSV